MSREEELDRLFEEYLSMLYSQDQEPELTELCAHRLDLLPALERLVRDHQRVDTLLSQQRRLAIGQRLGSYEVRQAIGGGGMGLVYAGVDHRTGAPVALKLLPPEVAAPASLLRFRREAKLLLSVRHPNVVEFYELLEVDPSLILVMQLLEGPTLDELTLPLPLDLLSSIALQLSAALDFLHDHQVLHRDLKPSNIKLEANGNLRVLDFGLAKNLDQTTTDSLTATDEYPGTLLYMAPEQLVGVPATTKSDAFAFGVILYQLATGTHPFARDNPLDTVGEIIEGHPAAASACRPELPAHLSDLIAALLEKDPRRRPAGRLARRVEPSAGSNRAGRSTR